MKDKQSGKAPKIRCWEFFNCSKKTCPGYKAKDLRCWLYSGTQCRDEIQGKFLEKMEVCIDCAVFRQNVDLFSTKETFELINQQLKEFRRIVESKNRALKRLATTDKLTGAYNRRKFEEIITREIERFRRFHKPLSMIIFDIDNFKNINDRQGHNAGDYALIKIVDVAKRAMRKIDCLIRWGGEEFMIVSPETNLKEAQALAARIKKTIETSRYKNIGNITASFGVAEFMDGDTEDTLVSRADDMMYRAKKKGGG